MNKEQKVFADSNQQLGNLFIQIDTFYQSLPEPIRKAYDNLGTSMRYGCHADLDPGQEPDDCVIPIGKHHYCIHAKGKSHPEQCEDWKPVVMKLMAE